MAKFITIRCDKNLWAFLMSFVIIVSHTDSQPAMPGTWKKQIGTRTSSRIGPGLADLVMNTPMTSVGGMLSLSQHGPNPLPPPTPRECTSATGCSTISGCCLRGRCSSSSGGVFDPCYTQEAHNGRAQFHGVWTQSDLCPCAPTYICLGVDSRDVHPQYGPRGFCMPAIG